MKGLCTIFLLLTLSAFAPVANKPVGKIDLNRFGGKWYSLYSIPTIFDKGTRETTTEYVWNKDGYYNVTTTAKKGDDNELHTYTSKLFPCKDCDGDMKAQFMWPFKVDYWVVDIAPDYSWVVVGHPDHKFLFIMSRKPGMNPQLYAEIVDHCKSMGYPVEKLTCQGHRG